MNSTAIIRFIDEKGRIVIPKEIRTIYNIKEHDYIEMTLEGDEIIIDLFRVPDSCIITGLKSENNFAIANGKILLSLEGAKTLAKELKNLCIN